MIKFIHKKHTSVDSEKGKIVIYYNVSDIFLGVILFALTVFFINDYLSHSFKKYQNNCPNYPAPVSNTDKDTIKS